MALPLSSHAEVNRFFFLKKNKFSVIWKSLHWHLGISIGIAKILFLPYETQIDYAQYSLIFFLVPSFTFTLLQLFISLQFPFIHTDGSISVLGKKLFEFLEVLVHYCSKKNAVSRILRNFWWNVHGEMLLPTNCLSVFNHFVGLGLRVLSTLPGILGSFPRSCIKQLFWSFWFCKKELRRRRHLWNFPEFWKQAWLMTRSYQTKSKCLIG